MISKNMLL